MSEKMSFRQEKKQEDGSNEYEHDEYPFFKYKKIEHSIPEHRQVKWEEENLAFTKYISYEIDWADVDWKKNLIKVMELIGTNKDSTEKIKRILPAISRLLKSGDKESVDHLINEKFGKWTKTGKTDLSQQKEYKTLMIAKDSYISEQLLVDIVRVITNNRAPNYTWNHKMFGARDNQRVANEMFKDQFLTEKIFNLKENFEYFDKLSGKKNTRDFLNFCRTLIAANSDAEWENTKFIWFDDPKDPIERYHVINFDLKYFCRLIKYCLDHKKVPANYDDSFNEEGHSKTVQEIYNLEWSHVREAIKMLIYDLLSNPKRNFIIMKLFSMMGRNAPEDYYHTWGDTFSELKNVFCFSERNPMLKKYMQKIRQIYAEGEEHKLGPFFSRDYNYNSSFNSNSLEGSQELAKERLSRIVRDNKMVRRTSHPFIPIFLNDPDLPEPSWCWAEYAVIFTKNKLRILQPIIEQKKLDHPVLPKADKQVPG